MDRLAIVLLFISSLLFGQDLTDLFYNDLPVDIFQNQYFRSDAEEMLQDAVEIHPDLLYVEILRINLMYETSNLNNAAYQLIEKRIEYINWQKNQYLLDAIAQIKQSAAEKIVKEEAVAGLEEHIIVDIPDSVQDVDPGSIPQRDYIIAKYYLSDPLLSIESDVNFREVRDSVEHKQKSELIARYKTRPPALISDRDFEYLVDHWYLFQLQEDKSTSTQFYEMFLNLSWYWEEPRDVIFAIGFNFGPIAYRGANEIETYGPDFGNSTYAVTLEGSQQLFGYGGHIRFYFKREQTFLSYLNVSMKFGDTEENDSYSSEKEIYSNYYVEDGVNYHEGYQIKQNEFLLEESKATFIFVSTPIVWPTKNLVLEAVFGVEMTEMTYVYNYDYLNYLSHYVGGYWENIYRNETFPRSENYKDEKIHYIVALGIGYYLLDYFYLGARLGYKYADLNLAVEIKL